MAVAEMKPMAQAKAMSALKPMPHALAMVKAKAMSALNSIPTRWRWRRRSRWRSKRRCASGDGEVAKEPFDGSPEDGGDGNSDDNSNQETAVTKIQSAVRGHVARQEQQDLYV